MKHNEFERRLRALEYFHTLGFLPGVWAVIRVDGHGFSRLTESRYEKPFDPKFHACMVQTARTLLEEFQGIYSYTESDEISVLLPREWDLFDRELEKAVSLSAGLASATFTHSSGAPAHFDSRVWLSAEDSLVLDYFRWRQADATRCALNGCCYWTLRKTGKSVKEATAALEGQSLSWKNELLFQHGVNFNNLPAWQRRGVGLYWQEYVKEGYNPKRQEKVVAVRRRIAIDEELPMKEEYSRMLEQILNTGRIPPSS